MKKILVLALGLVLVASACNKSATNTGNTPVTPTPTATQPAGEVPNPAPAPAPLSGKVEIQVTDAGFGPANVTVKSGTVVTFKNTTTHAVWPASDPHPTHTNLPGFDANKNLTTNQTYSFTFTKVGTWGFHNHLNPTQHGSVTVVQ